MLSNAIILMKFCQKEIFKIQKIINFEILKLPKVRGKKKEKKRHLTLVPSFIPKHSLSFF
jgi:hypothetical protein